MSFISVFDVLGPNMIGPSSSHTAGAARIAYLAQKMINGPLVRVDFTLYGSFARTYRGHEQTVHFWVASWGLIQMTCGFVILSGLQKKEESPFVLFRMKKRQMCIQIP